jgi:hypothetical protein
LSKLIKALKRLPTRRFLAFLPFAPIPLPSITIQPKGDVHAFENIHADDQAKQKSFRYELELSTATIVTTAALTCAAFTAVMIIRLLTRD